MSEEPTTVDERTRTPPVAARAEPHAIRHPTHPVAGTLGTIQRLAGNRAAGAVARGLLAGVQRIPETHEVHQELVPPDDPIAAIRRATGFIRSLRSRESQLQSFAAVGTVQPWMFHPEQTWILTATHVITIDRDARIGMIRPRAANDPTPREAGHVHLRMQDNTWLQLVLATPGNTVIVRRAGASGGEFGNLPVVQVISQPGLRLAAADVRRVEAFLGHGEEAEGPDAAPEQGEEGEQEEGAGDAAGGGGGGGRPRARELTPPWAMEQVAAANHEAQRRRAAAATDEQEGGNGGRSPEGAPPEQIMSLPNQVARARRGGIVLRVRQERWQTGRQLLERLIRGLDRMVIPETRLADPDLPESVPDWVRHQFVGARSLLEADRRRLAPLTEDARDAATRTGDRDADIAEAEARQTIERRLLEQAAGLPEHMELDHGGRRPHAVRIRMGRRAARVRMQEGDPPSALYARIRGAAGNLIAPAQPLASEPSDLIQGQRPPYPIAIELMGSTTAVVGRAQWFRMEIDTGTEPPPQLAVSWFAIPVEGAGDDVALGQAEIAEHGAVADQQLREMAAAREEAAREDLGVRTTGDADLDAARTRDAMVASGEMIGQIVDVGRWVIGHIAERSAERGILFDRPGRFVVGVVAQPNVDESDRNLTGIGERNIRAPSRTAITMGVVETDERLEAVVEENVDDVERREVLLREIATLEARIDDLDEDDEQLTRLQAELTDLRASLAQLEGRVHIARGRGAPTTHGYLSRRIDAANAQRDLVDDVLAHMGSGDEVQQRHALRLHARRLAEESGETEETPAGDTDPPLVRLYDELRTRWDRERNRGLERPPFTEWLRQQRTQLQQASDVASRQRTALFTRGRDFGRAERLPAALITNDGRQLPLILALQGSIRRGTDGQPGSTTYRILDLSEVGAPDTSDNAPQFEGTAEGTDDAAAAQALRRAVAEYVDEAGYGYGQLIIRRPVTLAAEVAFDEVQRFRLRPSERERWIERLENIATVVGIVGIVATGPVGIALGVAGGLAGGAAAGLRMSQRSDRGTLDLDSQTGQDLLDIFTAPLAVATGLRNLRNMSRAAQEATMIARLESAGASFATQAAVREWIHGTPDVLDAVADIDDIVGAIQAAGSVYLLPSGVYEGVLAAQSIEGETERRRAIATALASGAIQLPGTIAGLRGAADTVSEMHGRLRERRTRGARETPDAEGGSDAAEPVVRGTESAAEHAPTATEPVHGEGRGAPPTETRVDAPTTESSVRDAGTGADQPSAGRTPRRRRQAATDIGDPDARSESDEAAVRSPTHTARVDGSGSGAPGPDAPALRPHEVEHQRFLDRLRSIMQQPIPHAPHEGPPLVREEIGRFSTPDEAYAAFREAVRRAGPHEVAIFFHRERGEYAVVVGDEHGVDHPDDGRWECPLHTHPTPDGIRRFRMPSIVDVAHIAGERGEGGSGRAAVGMIEFALPDGSRGMCRVEITADGMLTFEYPGQDRPERFHWTEYEARWHRDTIYVDPGSDQADRFRRDIHAHLLRVSRDREWNGLPPLDIPSAPTLGASDSEHSGGRRRQAVDESDPPTWDDTTDVTEAPVFGDTTDVSPPPVERTSGGDIIDRGGVIDERIGPNEHMRRELFDEDRDPAGPHSARYSAQSRLEPDGTMTLDFSLRGERDGEMFRSGGLRGRDEFRAGLQHFRDTHGRDAVRRIRSEWGDGDNLPRFRELEAQFQAAGMPPDQAALAAAAATTTGRWFAEAGFGHIASVDDRGGSVVVVWAPGPSNAPPPP